MIVITGVAGFIASYLAETLSNNGENIVGVDDFSKTAKARNWQSLQKMQQVERSVFFDWLDKHHQDVEAVYHLGARTDTTEFDETIFAELNERYSRRMWQACCQYHLPLVYASSAATYGMGEFGYADQHALVAKLKPLNPYGESKNNFDRWAIEQHEQPPFWAGMKFFNVYGPNEYHKGRMASVVFHTFQQIRESGAMKLFRSHHPDYADGMQLRDFVYVGDVAKVLRFMMEKQPESGLYNLGTGQARAFLDLARATFAALDMEAQISFVDTPIDIRDKYQYYTQADIRKLRRAGYTDAFETLEKGVGDYVKHLVKWANETSA